jgi:DNA-binding ferritin-like protein
MAMQKLSRPTIFSSGPTMPSASSSMSSENSPCCTQTAALGNELMNAGTSFHKLHLRVTGLGSYAAHKALNEIYDALPNHADDLIESYQGCTEKILDLPNTMPRTLNTVEEALSYLRDIISQVDSLQAIMPYSNIVNELDNVKTSIDGVKYKLLFLK